MLALQPSPTAMGGFWLALAAQALSLVGALTEPRGAQNDVAVIEVPNGGPWGAWAWPERCPEGTFSTGFSIKVEPYQGPLKDDTALNGIRLYCAGGSDGDRREAPSVESQSGLWGRWSEPAWCPRGGYLVRFSLRVEKLRPGLQDGMGATNVRFACSGGETLEGSGLAWGDYGAWSPACRKGLCGVQTKQEPLRGLTKDDTALNDARFLCCRQ